jgi:DNA-binding transcriptional LysR family regulator
MSREPSWDAWQVFQGVMATGSLSAAARTLGLSQATVRGRIDELEAALETVLFVRSAAGMSPTDQARSMSSQLEVMRRASEALVRTASGGSGAIEGTVRISVSEFVGAFVLPPMLGRLRERYPKAAIELVPSNTSSDLGAQEADLAVRMFRPKGEGLVARKVGTIALGLYASQDYVARRGLPRTPEELLTHDIISPDRSSRDWLLASQFQFQPALADAPCILRTDSHVVRMMAVRAGLGIGVIQRPVAALDTTLVPVLPEHDFATLELFVVVQEDMRKLPKVRAVLDWLVEEFEQYAR